MKRIVDYFLLDWKSRKRRKPLIVRGARQVGKTYAVQKLGKTFKSYVEINLEKDKVARNIMEEELDVKRIITRLGEHKQIKIIPGETLLFFDEIQQVPQAILALRYFFEDMPELHVVAASSLLDFAIEKVGMPVGRVNTLYMYPMSFLEFLAALGHKEWVSLILTRSQLFEELHIKLMEYLGMYLAIGGFPDAINAWREEGTSREVRIAHTDVIHRYTEDFGTYGKKHQIKYLDKVFKNALQQLSRKFMYARIEQYKKRELEPAIDMLAKAGILYQVFQSPAILPLGSEAKLEFFKVIFLDVGLSQALLDYDISSWFIDPLKIFDNKGELMEAFVGQELLAYADPIKKENLYYWRLASSSKQAEIDYLTQLKNTIIPIEVKSGKSTHLTSMYTFLNSHPKTPYGIRFWADTAQQEDNIRSLPLYMVSKLSIENKDYLKEALMSLAS